MKALILTLFKINLIICVLLSANMIFAQVESTLAGGNWSDDATWIGNNPPNPADDVIINGPVVLDISPTCNNITIEALGSISNIGSGNRTLIINGDITNHGTTNDVTYTLTLSIYGNVYNDGNWSNGNTYLYGTTGQDFWTSTPIYSNNFNNISAINTINITSNDITFIGCKVNLGGGNMVFGNGSLSVFDEYLYNGVITSDQLNLTSNDGAYLDDLTCNANFVWLHGIVEISTDVIFNENTSDLIVEVVDTLQNRNSANRTMTINGSLHNNGVIRDVTYDLILNIEGSLVNSGEWTNNNTNLTGNTNQFLTFNEEFAGENFYSYMSGGGIATGTNALRFIGTEIDFNGDSLYMNAGYDSIFVDGGYVYDITIIAGASPWQVYCHQTNDAYYNDVNIEGDDVVLDGIFQFETFFNIEGNARVEGIFQNRTSANRTATINGNMTNNGTIQDFVYDCILYITGDIYQNGIWNNQHTYLSGDNDQSLNFTKEYSGHILTNSNINGKVISNSTLNFNSTIIDFNYDTLMFAAGADSLILSGDYFQEAVITKEGAKTAGFLNCTLNDDAYFHDIIIAGEIIDLNGTVQFTSPLEFIGHVKVEGILQNRATSNYTATINGDLTNNGEIRDYVYNCYLNITGDINQNGIWSNYNTYLDGDLDQTLFFSETFEGERLTNSNVNGKVISNSTLSFSNTIINFDYDTLMFSATADSLILDGFYFQEVVIIKEGSKTSGFFNCTMTNSAYFHDAAIIGDNIDLGGNFQYTSPLSFYGNVTVSGVLETKGNSSNTTYIYGDVTNNGAVQNNVYSTTLYITGNISQNGIWSNYYTYLNGSTTQTVSQTSPFSCYRIVDTDPLSAVQATSDLEFQNTDIDLGGATLMMQDNLMLSITDAWFVDANITSNAFDLTMVGNSYLQNTSLQNASLYEFVQVSSGCTFSGETKVMDTLSTYANSNYTLIIDGDITNNGSIQNNSYSLYLTVTGNLINNGTWTNSRTILYATEDQSIYLVNNQEITGDVYFDALSAGSPYQWYYEGGILDSPDFTGETGNNLVWQVPVSPSWYGDFYCQTGAGVSRTITIEGGLIVNISCLLEGSFNGTNMNTTLNDNGHIPLTQPYNVAPWNYSGTESVVSVPFDVTDWVLIEFRETAGGPETATPGTMITQRALFLNEDGYIVNLDGSRDIKIAVPTVTDNLHVVVWHRNHLGVMTSSPVSFDSAPYFYDFTSGESQAYGGLSGHTSLGSGKYGMMGGDADYNQEINSLDKGVWTSNVGNTADYELFDFNMDNKIDNLDKNDIWVGNSGQETQVPE